MMVNELKGSVAGMGYEQREKLLLDPFAGSAVLLWTHWVPAHSIV